MAHDRIRGPIGGAHAAAGTPARKRGSTSRSDTPLVGANARTCGAAYRLETRSFRLGLTAFVVASALCGLVDGEAWVIAARSVPGSGRAMGIYAGSSIVLVTMLLAARVTLRAPGTRRAAAGGSRPGVAGARPDVGTDLGLGLGGGRRPVAAAVTLVVGLAAAAFVRRRVAADASPAPAPGDLVLAEHA